MLGKGCLGKILCILFFSPGLLLCPGRACTVTTAADSGPGSLRQCIANAASGETITFSVSGTIVLTSGELPISKGLTISGPGAGSLTIQRSTATGTAGFRIFNIQSGIVLIAGLTLSNGRTNAGGGVYNATTTVLRDCAITDNSATSEGGGVLNLSSLILSNCFIAQNSVEGSSAAAHGGGLNNAVSGTITVLDCNINNNSVFGAGGTNGFGAGVYNAGTLTSTNCTISGNFANGSGAGILNEGSVNLFASTVSYNTANGGPGLGGGIANTVGTVMLCNSTVSGNGARQGTAAPSTAQGAGIFNNLGTVGLYDSTVTANSIPGGLPQAGGGLANINGAVRIRNTILSGNAAAADVSNGQQGDMVSEGCNIIGSTNGPVVVANGDRFNLTGPQLKIGPLQDNGGPTFTHALLCGSPAINTGCDGGCGSTDQRGFPRIVGGVIDVGAYESGNPFDPCSTACEAIILSIRFTDSPPPADAH